MESQDYGRPPGDVCSPVVPAYRDYGTYIDRAVQSRTTTEGQDGDYKSKPKSFVVVEQFWCQCCGTTEQSYAYDQLAEAMAELDLKNKLHASGKCCGSCTRTAWLEHREN